jgi:hypothetical protein
MKHVIEQQLKSVLTAVDEQSNRITSELSANYDGQNAAQSAFNTSMAKVADLRRQADELQAKAILELDTALTNCGSVGLSIINQLNDGQIVTGTPTPARRPRLVQPAQTAKAAQ